jgi:hypothetical protein
MSACAPERPCKKSALTSDSEGRADVRTVKFAAHWGPEVAEIIAPGLAPLVPGSNPGEPTSQINAIGARWGSRFSP